MAEIKNRQRNRGALLGIVVPCYNEKDVLRETTARLVEIMDVMIAGSLVDEGSAIYYVDDGSQDGTWSLIEKLASRHAQVKGIKLSRNRGHQNALLCGLMNARGDMLISVDADLQDDLNVIPQMVEHYHHGCGIVYGVRSSRETDTFFKRGTAEFYYKIMAAIKIDIVFNHADFRLLSRAAVDSLSEYKEVNLFLRGLVRLVGYPSAIVEYERADRFAGESKYPLHKMLSFAWQGITSFSTAPLRMITGLGFVISFVSCAMAFWAITASVIFDKALPGWTSVVVPMYFLGGIQLLSLGVIGEYIAKIYMESKGRPRFHVEAVVGESSAVK